MFAFKMLEINRESTKEGAKNNTMNKVRNEDEVN